MRIATATADATVLTTAVAVSVQKPSSPLLSSLSSSALGGTGSPRSESVGVKVEPAGVAVVGAVLLSLSVAEVTTDEGEDVGVIVAPAGSGVVAGVGAPVAVGEARMGTGEDVGG